MTTSCCQSNKRGFTLVELLAVIAIMAILVAIGIPAYNDYVNKARVARAVSDIKMLEREIISYKVDNGTFPDSLNDIGYGSLQDPWNNPYNYLNIEDGGVKGKGKLRRDRFLNPLNTDFDLYSTGADGASQTNLNAKDSRDDVVRATNGGFVGLASYF
ncbi:MAG: prepilin-type N-terminal cleavage/methylation domain-containing protein [Syntrophaceae bacterium]|nr:prepilin-type N-terminal cleavage/methylation domain-containing protein [Syntrophaceae bacterium]